MLVIREHESKWDNCRYELFIVDNGPVGDKLNFNNADGGGPGKHGKKFPPEASDRFLTIEEAMSAHTRMMEYVKDILAKPADKRPGSLSTWT